jgi:hypothetical protein
MFSRLLGVEGVREMCDELLSRDMGYSLKCREKSLL